MYVVWYGKKHVCLAEKYEEKNISYIGYQRWDCI